MNQLNEMAEPEYRLPALTQKKIKFSSYTRKFKVGAVTKSFMTVGLLIYGKIFDHFLIYWEAFPHI